MVHQNSRYLQAVEEVEALSNEATVADVCHQLRSMFGEADGTGQPITLVA